MFYVLRILKGVVFTILKGTFNPSLARLKNKNATKKCMLIGNGASLNNELDEIYLRKDDEDIFVCNAFVSSIHYQKLKPSFYILYDPSYWDENVDKSIRKREIIVLNKIRDETDWPLNIITNYSGEKRLRSFFKMNNNVHVFSGNSYVLNSPAKFSHFLYTKFLTTPIIQNVMVGAIYAAIGLGYKQINLFGVEHSWTKEIRVNGNNEVCLIDNHFFDVENNVASLKPWKKVYGGIYKMDEILTTLAKMFKGYFYIKAYADYKGAKIINWTRDSFIDAFERRNV